MAIRKGGSFDDGPEQPSIPGMTRVAEEKVLAAGRILYELRERKKAWIAEWKEEEKVALDDFFEALDEAGIKAADLSMTLRNCSITQTMKRKVKLAFTKRQAKGGSEKAAG